MAFQKNWPPVEAVPLLPAPRDRTPWGYADMAMAIGIIVGTLIIVSIPIFVIVGIVVGDELEDGDETVRAAEIGASFALEGLLLLVVALFTVRKYKLRWAALGLRPPKRGGFWFPLPVFFAAMTVFGVYAAIVAAAGVDAEGNIPADTFDSTVLIVLLGILALALAPFMEEVFFRGFLFGGLRGRWGVLGAALGSGLIFALPHFSGVASLTVIPVIGIIGMLFAWSYYYTGSLFAPIVAHFLFNLTGFVIAVSGVGT